LRTREIFFWLFRVKPAPASPALVQMIRAAPALIFKVKLPCKRQFIDAPTLAQPGGVEIVRIANHKMIELDRAKWIQRGQEMAFLCLPTRIGGRRYTKCKHRKDK